MSIKENQAKLWFDSEEEQKAYDDKMIANIELKSTDFDDENFSPVFNRQTQEFFLEPSERFRNDMSKINTPFKGQSFEQLVDKYLLVKPNHTYYRSWTYEKFLGSFGLGYIFLRELPLRNFYARCFVMYVFASKLLDHLHSPFPFFGPNGDLIAAADNQAHWDLRCYDNVWRALKFVEIPTVMNKVRESKVWNGKQPGHLLRSDVWFVPHYFGAVSRNKRNVGWDGTQNMPIFRLADPKHKDSYMIQYI